MKQVLFQPARDASQPSTHLTTPQVRGAVGFVRCLTVAAAVAMLAAAGQADAQLPVCGVFRQLWSNLDAGPGNTLAVLTNTTASPNWPNNPNPAYTKNYSSFETEVNTGMNYYGQLLRAFVVPP